MPVILSKYTIDLTSYSGQNIKIRFRGEIGTYYRSDMAIDNISLTNNEPCPTTISSFPYTESFESGLGDNYESWYKLLGISETNQVIAYNRAGYVPSETANNDRSIVQLAEELHTWDSSIARKLETNLQPLTDLIIEKYIDFLPKLNYPLRVGTHPNTAFGLSFAYDYAETTNNDALKVAIATRAKYFFLNDKNCPMLWEPSGSDFLSPCLEEAALMKRLLPKEEFKPWLDAFLPKLKNKNYTLEVGLVSDRTDGQLVHLDGVNFSRAWSLNKIAEGLPEYSHLKFIANHHVNYSLPSIVGDSYEGGHWLASFAIYALNSTSE